MAIEPSEGLRLRHQYRAKSAGPPARPQSEADLRFTRQLSTRWFSPSVLADAGLRVVLSSAFGEFLDKRELQASLVEEKPLAHRVDQPELWMDFISDTGDGFNATYTVAWLAAQKELNPPGAGRPLPRGSMVVLGGDEVYPVGDADAYENRFVGPYRAALPWTRPPDNPELYALPGNHDWYDGLTAFMRVFGQGAWIGGRRCRQSRSYFAVELPHRWWLWGIDIQFDSYIDDPQLRYFEKVVKERFRKNDRVILCTAKPSWIDVGTDPRAYKNLAFLEQRLIRQAEATVMLTLSGDSHHYARFVGPDGSHKVTAGGGGAFLHPTHDLDTTLEVPIDPVDETRTLTFTRAACYPDESTSRRLALGAIGLPLRNPSFMAVTAVVYVLLGWSSQFSLRAFGEQANQAIDEAAPKFGWLDMILGLGRNPISVLLILVFLGGLVGFAKPPPKWLHGWKKLAVKIALGVAHLLMQLVAVILIGLLAVRIADALFDGGAWFTVTLLVVMGLFGGIVGGLTTGLYLALANAIPGLDAHGNETFSAQRLTTYKNFLRIHIDADGLLHVYPLGVRHSVKKWRLDRDGGGDAEAPWLAPDGDAPKVHLIEPPFTVDGRAPRA